MLNATELINELDKLSDFGKPILQRELNNIKPLEFVIDCIMSEVYNDTDTELCKYIKSQAMNCLTVVEHYHNKAYWILDWK